MIKVKVPFMNEISDIAIIKILDGSTYSIIGVGFSYCWLNLEG